MSEKCVKQLIGNMLKGGNALTVGVGIIIEVIRKNNSDYDLDSQAGPEPRTSDPIYLGTMLRQFSSHISDFMTLIRSPKAAKPGLKAAFGERIQPLGFDRFKTCELMAELLHCSNMGLLNERGSEAEMVARDAEREKLKVEGKLQEVPSQPNPESDDQFASSVDSHGFHHARVPSNEEAAEKANRLEIQNATDEDEFEKVGVSDADDLPDEVTFDDLTEKLEELAPLSPRKKKSEEKHPEGGITTDRDNDKPTSILSEQMERLDVSEKHESKPDSKPRISSLTKRIEDHISDTEHTPESEEDIAERSGAVAAARPEDRPAPLFFSKPTSEKGFDPILGNESPPSDEQDQTVLSTATLQPEHQENAPTSDQYPYELDMDGTPVVGDLLKIQFVEQQVVPTILVSSTCVANDLATKSSYSLSYSNITRTSSSAFRGTTSFTTSFTMSFSRCSTVLLNADTIAYLLKTFSRCLPVLRSHRRKMLLREFWTVRGYPTSRKEKRACVLATWVI